MDPATTTDADADADTTPPDAPHRGCNDPHQSPDRPPASVVAQRFTKAGPFDSSVRRSPCLSCLPPPQPPMECHDTNTDDESESVNDVALHLSREDTPDNDVLPPDEPSTVLASRILRASDNPSPPPQDLAHPGVNYIPGKDGLFPSHNVSAPPSPFRPINLLERLNQPSIPPFDPSRTLSTPTLARRLNISISQSNTHTRGDFVSPESRLQSVASKPMEDPSHEDRQSTDTLPSSPNQSTVDDLPRQSSRRVCELANITDSAKMNPSSEPPGRLHGQLINTTSPVNIVAYTAPLTQAVNSSLVRPLGTDVCLESPLSSSGAQGYSEPLPFALNTTALLPALSNEDGKASLPTETIITGVRDNDEEKSSIMNDNNLSASDELQNKCIRDADSDSHQRLDPPHPHAIGVSSGPVEQTIVFAESTSAKHLPATPPQTPRPNISLSTVQRPVVVPTPVRTNNTARELYSPAKFSSGVDDICRTPAQRVPIETALACGTSSFQKSIQQSTGPDYSQMGRLPTIRGLIFTRPLGDPSRSPAKRIPATDLRASPTREDQSQVSPTRSYRRVRSVSVEPRSLGPGLSRNRSVEPSPTVTKRDNHERRQEFVFPMAPVPPRYSTKLPFPLIPGQKSSSDLPPPILEDNETFEIGNTESDAALGKVAQSMISQLRQPSTNSRIPRIGNKPYTRLPSKDGKTPTGTITARATRTGVPKASPFQHTHKNNAVGNSKMEISSTQFANDLRSIGSLKRKRGAEASTLSNTQPVMVRQVVPGILGGKYALNPAKIPSQVRPPSELSPPKVVQPLKFRKVVDGMLSARYAPTKANIAQIELSDSNVPPPSPLSELSSSSNEEPSDDKRGPTTHSFTHHKGEKSDPSRTSIDVTVAECITHDPSSPFQHTDNNGPSSRLRRTSRARKPAQQQYVLDVFNSNTPTQPPPARRKPPQPRTEGDGFMGMSATALKALTTSNTTKNQQTVAVLATEVVRKEGLRPESPTVKARTILQKQRDERDMRRKGRAQRRAQMSGEVVGASETEGPPDHDENDYAVPQRHCRGPGDEDDYETPDRPEHIIEPLKLEETNRDVKPVKQVKWHRGLSTAIHLDEVDPRPRSLPKNVQVVMGGCLAPRSKNLRLDPLGNLADIDNRPSLELVTEQVIVKKYLYDNDIEPEPVPAKMTRSKSKKSRS